jgi:hypothetical protein
MSSAYRKILVIGAGAALLVGLTAGPLSAASPHSKTYTVTVNPTTLPYGTPSVTSPFSFSYTNTTPSATINSVTLSAPSGYTIDATSVAVSGNTGNYSIATSSAAPQITVTNLYPVGYQATVTLSFTATVDTSNLSCSSSAGTWTPTAWTGSNLSGHLFTPTNTATTTVGTNLDPGGTTTYTDANGNTVTVTNVGTTCTPLSISRSGNTTTINKPTIAGVALTADVVWDPEPAQYPLPATQVDTPGGWHNLLWCDGTMSSPDLPAGTNEVSCLVTESSKIVGPDASGTQQVQIEDLIYLLGDISFSHY